MPEMVVKTESGMAT